MYTSSDSKISMSISPKLCYTASGILVHKNKVLLVKHKKLGIWLNPGGHIDEDELPHVAAEREFFEETGVLAKAVAIDDSLPVPFAVDLHWVNQESYNLRLQADDSSLRVPTNKWKRGCEQHICFIYLLEIAGSDEFVFNEKETDAIAWFSVEEIDNLDTVDSIKAEIKQGFKLASDLAT